MLTPLNIVLLRASNSLRTFQVAKLAWLAQEQGSYVYGNLINIAKEKPITPYKPGTVRDSACGCNVVIMRRVT